MFAVLVLAAGGVQPANESEDCLSEMRKRRLTRVFQVIKPSALLPSAVDLEKKPKSRKCYSAFAAPIRIWIKSLNCRGFEHISELPGIALLNVNSALIKRAIFLPVARSVGGAFSGEDLHGVRKRGRSTVTHFDIGHSLAFHRFRPCSDR